MNSPQPMHEVYFTYKGQPVAAQYELHQDSIEEPGVEDRLTPKYLDDVSFRNENTGETIEATLLLRRKIIKILEEDQGYEKGTILVDQQAALKARPLTYQEAEWQDHEEDMELRELDE